MVVYSGCRTGHAESKADGRKPASRRLCGLGPYHLVPDHVVANHILVHTLADPVLVERMRCDERTVDVLLCELKAMAEAGLLHMSLAVVEVAIGCMYAHVPSRTRRRPQRWS